jgi:NAD(P)-dependent dehydrogenase (short-subunit alcohol dehydrogenase family)
VKAEKGKLDIVFANAAFAETAGLEQVTEEHFDRHFDINVKAQSSLCKRPYRCLAKEHPSSSTRRFRASRERQGSASTPLRRQLCAISSGPGSLISRDVASGERDQPGTTVTAGLDGPAGQGADLKGFYDYLGGLVPPRSECAAA